MILHISTNNKALTISCCVSEQCSSLSLNDRCSCPTQAGMEAAGGRSHGPWLLDRPCVCGEEEMLSTSCFCVKIGSESRLNPSKQSAGEGPETGSLQEMYVFDKTKGVWVLSAFVESCQPSLFLYIERSRHRSQQLRLGLWLFQFLGLLLWFGRLNSYVCVQYDYTLVC